MFSYFFHSVLYRESKCYKRWIAKLKYWLKQTKSLEDSRGFVQLNWVCLGAFILQGSYSDNSLILHAQIFTFWRAERIFTQPDSIIPDLQNSSCEYCDTVNRMLLTLASACQRRKVVLPAQLLPAHRVTQTGLWSMACERKGPSPSFFAKRHARQTLIVSVCLICRPEVWVLSMSLFHCGWLHSQTFQDAQGALLCHCPSLWCSEVKMHHGGHHCF